MNLRNYKIGYVPYTEAGKGPGDRRRFIFYARENELNYEEAIFDKEYDIVYLTTKCSISQWINYKKKYPAAKIVYEIIDTYYLEGINFFTLFRGLVYFLTGREKKIYPDYRKAIIKMLKAADAVVCSTPVQEAYLRRYNANIHISLDYFLNDITCKKNNYQSNGKLKLVWEGQSYTVHHLLSINEVFKKLANQVEIHIITDSDIKYPFKIFNKKTASLLSALACTYYLHEWEKDTFSKIIAQADLAIIPLENNKYGRLDLNKPENKLLLFWQIGIPVITSASPAYCRVMDKAGLPLYCNNINQWEEKIEGFIQQSEESRVLLTQKASDYIEKYHSKEIILEKWDKIFLSLFNTYVVND